jgi:hypothetical protein
LRHTNLQGVDEQVVIKIRGIQLSYAATRQVTFERMKALVFHKFSAAASTYEQRLMEFVGNL